MIPLDFGMHWARIDRLREGGRHCLKRHAALWAIARLVGDDFRVHRARVFAGTYVRCIVVVSMLTLVLTVVIAMIVTGMLGIVLVHRLFSRLWANGRSSFLSMPLLRSKSASAIAMRTAAFPSRSS
jgi:hypothetical protein